MADANASAVTATLTLSSYTLPAVTTGALAGATSGTAYSQTLTASGGKAPYSWSIASGTLPAGVTLSTAGVIAGTPGEAGSATFTLRVADAGGVAASKALTLTVYAAPDITSATLADAYLATAYSLPVAHSGGMPPYSWSIIAGALPAGLALDPSTGVIGGTPGAAGSSSFTIKLADANGASTTRSLTIAGYSLPVVTSSSLAAATAGTAYSQTMAVSGGKAPYAWSIAAGALPEGITLSSSGVLSGTSGTTGTASFTVQVTDAGGMTASSALSLSVNAAPAITTATLPDAYLGTAYSQTVAHSGGVAPYTWRITGGALPAGVSLDPSTGVIGGVPSAAGSSTFTIQLADANGASTTKSLTIAAYSLPVVSTSSLAAATAGISYSQTMAVSGGKAPYAWSIAAGALPNGITLSSSGVLSGTVGATGTATFTVQVTDAGGMAARSALTLAVSAAPAITTAMLADAYLGRMYSQPVTLSGGVAPYNWRLIGGAVPLGLTLEASTGVIDGMPGAAGNSTFTVQLTDANGASTTKSLTIAAYSAPVITTAALPAGTAGLAYSQTVAAGGGKAPYSWSVTAGALPAGLTLNAATGVISGTPGVAGTASFTVQIYDANNIGATAALSITIAPRAVTVLNAWNNLYSAAPKNTSASNLNVGSFTVANGTDRLLLVSVVMATGSTAIPSISATYGGAALTEVKTTNNNQRETVWVGYLKASQLPAGAQTLAITYSGGSAKVNALHVKWAAFGFVNQTTPVAAFAGTNTSATSATFGSTINYVANGMTTAVAGNSGTPAVGSISAGDFSAGTATTTYQSSNTFTTAKHAASGSYAGSTAVSWSGTTSTASAVVAVSLQP